ncbi:GDSL-type esterase/lipase family protein [Providencia rettgeri]
MNINKLLITAIISLSALPLLGQCKPLFIGDSLTYELAMSYKERAPVDAKFLESTGLQSTKLLHWQNYIQKINFQQYDTVYIVLGTNDLIHQSDVQAYQQKAMQFLNVIKHKNKNIVWLLPPTLKNEKKNALLNNTRLAIKNAAYQEGIKTLDMRNALGNKYTDIINGVQVRTYDGIHITKNGANAVITNLIKIKYE